MASPTGPSTSSGGGMIPSEWPVQAADVIVETISKVRDKTTRPAQLAVRGLVYGLIAAVVALIALALLIVGIVRIYDNYAPGPVYWLYAALGLFFTVIGLVCLRKANSPPPPAD